MDVLIFCIVVLFGIFLVVIMSIKLNNRFGKAELVDMYSYQDKLVSVGKVYHSAEDGGFYHTRISLIDKKTGKIFHKVFIPGQLDVIGVENHQIWLCDKRIFAVDFVKNKVVFSTEQIDKQYPELDNTEFSNARLNTNSSKIFFKTDEGYRYFIDCKTLNINKIDEKAEINEDTDETELETDDYTLKSKQFCFEKPKKSDRYSLKFKKLKLKI